MHAICPSNYTELLFMSDNVKNYTDLQKLQPAAQMREVVKFEGV